jgi:two-component system response regulator DegU
VLLVDDHSGFRALVAEILGLEAGHYHEAQNGREAVELCRGPNCPDLVLMDLDMPELDGISATREILKRHPHLTIIILTQHDEPELRTHALSSGAFAFFTKVDLGQLALFLKNHASDIP